MTEYPIITTQGYGGGIGVEDWYKPDMIYLTDQQVELLEELLPTLTESKAAGYAKHTRHVQSKEGKKD
jgi:hypothetical protein